MLDDLYMAEMYLRRTIQQIQHLNYKMQMLDRRYNQAKTQQHRHFRCILHIRMLVIGGMLTAYGNYAEVKEHQIIDLRSMLNGVRPEAEDDDDRYDHVDDREEYAVGREEYAVGREEYAVGREGYAVGTDDYVVHRHEYVVDSSEGEDN